MRWQDDKIKESKKNIKINLERKTKTSQGPKSGGYLDLGRNRCLALLILLNLDTPSPGKMLSCSINTLHKRLQLRPPDAATSLRSNRRTNPTRTAKDGE